MLNRRSLLRDYMPVAAAACALSNVPVVQDRGAYFAKTVSVGLCQCKVEIDLGRAYLVDDRGGRCLIGTVGYEAADAIA